MSLCECESNATYRIKNVCLQESTGRRLENLGFKTGAMIKVISQKRGSFVVETAGKQIALCKNFAAAIDVE